MFCVPRPHTPPPPVCTPDGADHELPRVLVQLWGIGTRHIELAISHHPREQMGGCQHPAWFCTIEGRHTVLRNFPPRGKTKGRTYISTQKRWESPRIPRRTDRRSLLSQSVRTGGGSHFFRCEDSNTRLVGTWKIKGTWCYKRNLMTFLWQTQKKLRIPWCPTQ